jgi:hypothetical protein
LGNLFYAYDRDGHDAEVVPISIEYDPTTNQLKSVTFITIDFVENGETTVTLQRFELGKEAVSVPLSTEELHMLVRETGVLFERRTRRPRR